MSPQIPVRLIRQVRQRADDVCEYCHFPQSSQEATFQLTMCCLVRSTDQRNWKTLLWRALHVRFANQLEKPPLIRKPAALRRCSILARKSGQIISRSRPLGEFADERLPGEPQAKHSP